MALVDVATIKSKLREGCDHPSHDKAIDSIDGIFEPFATLPEPSSFDDSLEKIKAALEKLCPGGASEDPITKLPMNQNVDLLEINSVAGELTEWEGDSMESFRDNVQTPFPGVVHNLYIATTVLYGAIEAEKALWTAVREDIKTIGEKAVSAADKFCETGASQAAFWITCAGAVVAVALAPVTGGGSAAVYVAAVAGAFSAASQGVPADWNIDTPEEAVSAMKDACETVKKEIKAGETKIQQALRSINGLLEQRGRPYELLGDIHLVNGPGGLTGR